MNKMSAFGKEPIKTVKSLDELKKNGIYQCADGVIRKYIELFKRLGDLSPTTVSLDVITLTEDGGVRESREVCAIEYSEKLFVGAEELSEEDFKKIVDFHTLEREFQQYPEYIIKILRQRAKLDENDASNDKEFSLYSANEIFNEVVIWEGLGRAFTIKSLVKDIYGVDLDKISSEKLRARM